MNIDARLRELTSHVQAISELQSDMGEVLDAINHEVDVLDADIQREYQYTFLLEELKRVLQSVDLRSAFSFIDDVEEEIAAIPVKVKKALHAYKMAVNPILKNTPVYFDAENPPNIRDFLEKK